MWWRRLLCYPSTGVEVRRELVEEAAEKPGLTGAHETSDDSYHIPHVQTAGVEGLVYDLRKPRRVNYFHFDSVRNGSSEWKSAKFEMEA